VEKCEEGALMRMLVWLTAALLALCVAAAPVSARVVRMETRVALEDHSELSIRQALLEAFQISVRGALAMGLSNVSVDGARVLPGAVVLALVATDEVDADETRYE
jgi:hypothetical protein